MYFYVFLQPEMFEEAQADGEDATQNIASILNGFLQNCFVAVFEDDRWGTAVKEKLEIWPETMTRRRVKSILVQLKKRNRIIYNLVPDYNSKKPDIDCVFEQAHSVSLDLLMVIASEGDRAAPPELEWLRPAPDQCRAGPEFESESASPRTPSGNGRPTLPADRVRIESRSRARAPSE